MTCLSLGRMSLSGKMRLISFHVTPIFSQWSPIKEIGVQQRSFKRDCPAKKLIKKKGVYERSPPTIKCNLTCENRDIPKRNLGKSSVAAAPADSKSCPNRPGKEKTGQVGLTSDGLLAATSYSASGLLGPTYYQRLECSVLLVSRHQQHSERTILLNSIPKHSWSVRVLIATATGGFPCPPAHAYVDLSVNGSLIPYLSCFPYNLALFSRSLPSVVDLPSPIVPLNTLLI
ncbi:hypothetical protein TNCV_662941 [Trichonephila clavipes]|nr:hypothetical protein TNCV_662941 [Trichonephila clavipes]